MLHVSNELPGNLWLVEPRTKVANGSTERLTLGDEPATVVPIGSGRRLSHG